MADACSYGLLSCICVFAMLKFIKTHFDHYEHVPYMSTVVLHHCRSSIPNRDGFKAWHCSEIRPVLNQPTKWNYARLIWDFVNLSFRIYLRLQSCLPLFYCTYSVVLTSLHEILPQNVYVLRHWLAAAEINSSVYIVRQCTVIKCKQAINYLEVIGLTQHRAYDRVDFMPPSQRARA